MNVMAWTDAQTEAELRARGSLKWTATAPGVIGAWVAEMDLPPAPAITQALHEAVDRGLTGYLPEYLDAQIGTATADWQQRFGWIVDPLDVRPVASVFDACRIALDHLFAPGTPVVLPTPAYMPFLTLPGLVSRELITVPMLVDGDRYVLDLDAIATALRPGAVFVLTNPHNPTGRVFSTGELLALAEVVEHAGASVFADEIHAPLVYPGFTHVPYASLSAVTAAHTVTGISASKGWNVAGLGCAQVILSDDLSRARWAAMDPHSWYGATPLGAVATIAAYTRGTDHLAAVVDYLATGRDLFAGALAESLPAARMCEMQGTYLAWLDLRDTGCAPADVERLAAVRGVDGADCGTPGFLRVNLGLPHHLVLQTASRLAACAGVTAALR
jgi:cystathionine beta-lyase